MKFKNLVTMHWQESNYWQLRKAIVKKAKITNHVDAVRTHAIFFTKDNEWKYEC